jgi:hypothetical protein
MVLATRLGPAGHAFGQPVTATFGWDDSGDDGVVDGLGILESRLSVWRNGHAITGLCSAPACAQGTCSAACCLSGAPGSCTSACCNPATNRWTLAVNGFSEFVVLDATTVIPTLSSRGWPLLGAFLALAMGWAMRRRRALSRRE